MDQMTFAELEKQKGMARVWDNAPEDWKVLARRVVRTMRGQKVTGEDIKLRCLALEIAPHHHNAWGSFISRLASGKSNEAPLLIATKEVVKTKGKKSHARDTRVWIVRSDI